VNNAYQTTILQISQGLDQQEPRQGGRKWQLDLQVQALAVTSLSWLCRNRITVLSSKTTHWKKHCPQYS